MKNLIVVLVLFLTGCATQRELKTCRAQNQEYQRLLRSYADSEPMRGCEFFLLNGHEGYTCAKKVGHPTPSYGTIGFGQGGGH